jgi:sulfate transport system substrate-binding protein
MTKMMNIIIITLFISQRVHPSATRETGHQMPAKLTSLLLLTTAGLLPALSLSGCHNESVGSVELLNVSNDPTRELWRDINAHFLRKVAAESKLDVTVRQSHGGSGSQARAIVDGLEADVATLGLWSDTKALERAGLLDPDWETRLPNKAKPYGSTIVFVVRQGNPRGIHDWPDLAKPDVQIITPNPKTSGNGKLSFLAAWGSVLQAGGSEAQAEQLVRSIYRKVPVLDTAARAATVTFAQKKLGDVHLTWEAEAHLEVAESKGELEIVYPKTSIEAEVPVAVVDAYARRKGTWGAATAYTNYLYTQEAQELFAKHFYRPYDAEVLAQHADRFPPIDMFPITRIASSWDEANRRFFADGALFDTIYTTPVE